MNTENIVGKRFGDGVVTRLERLEPCESEIYKIDFEISYGKESLIKNRLLIPKEWNGRFVGIGNGGIAGVLGDAWYSFAKDGYAAAQSDLGTCALRLGEIEVASDDLWADYGHRAIHGMTVTAKAIIGQLTGDAPVYSYFYGASAGGKSALSEAQLHPTDYDGIVAGVPSNNGLAFITYLLWCYRKLGGDVGYPLIGAELSLKINECAVEFFKACGRAENGDDFITYPYCGENTVRDFMDFLCERIPELTEEQRAALRDVYTGPKNPRTGEQIFCGMPIGSEVNTGYFLGDGITDTFELPWNRIFYGGGFNDLKFDFDRDFERMLEGIGEHMSSNETDLSSFKANGGKLLVFSGAADPYGPFADHLNYYCRVCDRMGGIGNVADFFKYFIIPGKGHSTDGRGANMFTTNDTAADMIALIRAWREDGTPPEKLEVAHKYSDDHGGGYKFKRCVYAVDKIGKEGIDYPVCTSERILKK